MKFEQYILLYSKLVLIGEIISARNVGRPIGQRLRRDAPADTINADPQCADTCTAEMQKLIEATPFFAAKDGTSRDGNHTSGGVVDVARSSFFRAGKIGRNGDMSQQRNVMSQFFTNICESYEKVDACLTKCESQQILKSKDSYLNYHSNFWTKTDEHEDTGSGPTSAHSPQNNGAITMNLRQVYAGLQFICKERRADFFDALPCLSEYEPNAMLKCSEEINRSQETTLLFTNSIVNREFHNIQLRFGTLCRDLNMMMKCMEPTIRRGCGDQPTNLMLSFIGLEFSSFEKLNEQLGFDQPLPQACRQLIQYSYERRLKQTSRLRANPAETRKQQLLLSRQNFNLNVNKNGSTVVRLIAMIVIVSTFFTIIIW